MLPLKVSSTCKVWHSPYTTEALVILPLKLSSTCKKCGILHTRSRQSWSYLSSCHLCAKSVAFSIHDRGTRDLTSQVVIYVQKVWHSPYTIEALVILPLTLSIGFVPHNQWTPIWVKGWGGLCPAVEKALVLSRVLSWIHCLLQIHDESCSSLPVFIKVFYIGILSTYSWLSWSWSIKSYFTKLYLLNISVSVWDTLYSFVHVL